MRLVVIIGKHRVQGCCSAARQCRALSRTRRACSACAIGPCFRRRAFFGTGLAMRLYMPFAVGRRRSCAGFAGRRVYEYRAEQAELLFTCPPLRHAAVHEAISIVDRPTRYRWASVAESQVYGASRGASASRASMRLGSTECLQMFLATGPDKCARTPAANIPGTSPHLDEPISP